MDENLDRSDLSLPVSQLLEIDRICRQFEAAWQAGQQPKADDFLGDAQDPLRPQLRGVWTIKTSLWEDGI